MKDRVLVWDLPTRLFHWLLSVTVGGAMGIAFLVDDDSPLFQFHMMLGLIVAFLVILRMLWGLIGTRYARFGSFLFGPRALIGYLRGILQRSDKPYVGHNPGSGIATYAMLLLPLGIVLTGILMSTREGLKEFHEFMAYLLAATVAIHIIGLAWYTIRHREMIALSMIDGKKPAEASEAIASSRPLLGACFLVLAAVWTFLVLKGHDPQKSQVTLFGQTIQLSESEHNESGKPHDREHSKEDKE